MGSSIHHKLAMDCRRIFLPRVTNGLAGESTKIVDQSAKTKMLDEYIYGLEDEMKKIVGFKRELPNIMLLVHDAIVTMKEELVKCKRLNQEPVLEEFIPVKKSNSDDEEDGKSENSKQMDVVNSKEKMDWMRSVQLWNSDHNDKKRKETDRTSMDSPSKDRAIDKDGLSGLSLRMPEIKNLFEGNNSNHDIGLKSKFSCQDSNHGNEQPLRKQRRCWSPQLHQMFLDTLKQLGGHEVATPKQIRELMQVDGLTNDEVKSHLQKYRLHLRKAQAKGGNEFRHKMRSRSPADHLQGNAYLGTKGVEGYEDEDDEKSETIQLSCRD